MGVLVNFSGDSSAFVHRNVHIAIGVGKQTGV